MPWTRPGRCHAPPRMLDPASFFAASHPAGFVRAATEGAVSASRASSSRAAAADGGGASPSDAPLARHAPVRGEGWHRVSA